jgi:hypothetical protein
LYIAGTNSSIAPFVGGLVGWWKFEEGSGTTSTDSSGYAKQNVWYGSGSHWSSSSKSGSYSGVFNGTDDYISAASTVLSTGGNTISFWILLDSSSANSFGQNIFWSTFAPSATPYLAFAEKSGRFYIYGQPSNAGLDIGHGMPGAWRDSGALATGSWHHVVSTQSPSQQVVYIDGVQTASRSFGTTGNDNGINFGKSYWGLPNQAYLDGSLDDIRVYNRVLSAAEVSALYNATR